MIVSKTLRCSSSSLFKIDHLGSCTFFSTVINHEQAAISSSINAFSIAPMMDYTTRHQRMFQRLLTKKSVLYTEMVTANALIRNPNPGMFLESQFDVEEPLVLQLGGSNVIDMKAATKIAADFGYKVININCGCPSPKVAGSGCFGAALMLSPGVVRDMLVAMAEVRAASPSLCTLTVKCRIGVNERDSYEELCDFIRLLSADGIVSHFVIHARKAVLDKKFSAADNRNIPPLKYEVVYQLVRDFPYLDFTLNGGVTSMSQALEHYKHGVKGVMVGRAAIDSPFQWGRVDSAIYAVPDPGFSRREILARYAEYAQTQCERRHVPKSWLTKPVHHLFDGQLGAKKFRRHIEEYARRERHIADAILLAAANFSDEVLDAKV